MKLEWAKRRALMIAGMMAPPPDTDEQKLWVMIGLGYAIARGHVVYKGQNPATGVYGFEITAAGLDELWRDDEAGPEVCLHMVHETLIICLPDLTRNSV